MKNRYDQLNIEYVETKSVSPFIKYTCILFILIFAFIPLAELIDVLDYNYAAPNKVNTCIIGCSYEPLQFKPLPQPN
ncbi:hypothetical protein V1T75_05145 [Tenacibaculum sp. FZY0031]|uniref:hypothetical protein n=1 Tax=unclassified Tenacibaculum TaxID=2635139 RepID=UPI002EC09898|nr:hypothetical protein [Tenacibaculum sp. FZY0031]